MAAITVLLVAWTSVEGAGSCQGQNRRDTCWDRRASAGLLHRKRLLSEELWAGDLTVSPQAWLAPKRFCFPVFPPSYVLLCDVSEGRHTPLSLGASLTSPPDSRPSGHLHDFRLHVCFVASSPLLSCPTPASGNTDMYNGNAAAAVTAAPAAPFGGVRASAPGGGIETGTKLYISNLD